MMITSEILKTLTDIRALTESLIAERDNLRKNWESAEAELRKQDEWLLALRGERDTLKARVKELEAQIANALA